MATQTEDIYHDMLGEHSTCTRRESYKNPRLFPCRYQNEAILTLKSRLNFTLTNEHTTALANATHWIGFKEELKLANNFITFITYNLTAHSILYCEDGSQRKVKHLDMTELLIYFDSYLWIGILISIVLIWLVGQKWTLFELISVSFSILLKQTPSRLTKLICLWSFIGVVLSTLYESLVTSSTVAPFEDNQRIHSLEELFASGRKIMLPNPWKINLTRVIQNAMYSSTPEGIFINLFPPKY